MTVRLKCSNGSFFKVQDLIGLLVNQMINIQNPQPSMVELVFYDKKPDMRVLVYEPELFINKTPSQVFHQNHWKKALKGGFSSNSSKIKALSLEGPQPKKIRLKPGSVFKVGALGDTEPPIVIQVEEVGNYIFLCFEGLSLSDIVRGTKLKIPMVKAEQGGSCPFLKVPKIVGIHFRNLESHDVRVTLHERGKPIAFLKQEPGEVFNNWIWKEACLMLEKSAQQDGNKTHHIKMKAGDVLRIGTSDYSQPAVIVHAEKREEEVFLIIERPGPDEFILGSGLNTALVRKLDKFQLSRAWTRIPCSEGPALKILGQVGIQIERVKASSVNMTLFGRRHSIRFLVQNLGQKLNGEWERACEQRIRPKSSTNSGGGVMNLTLKPGAVLLIGSLKDKKPKAIIHLQKDAGAFVLNVERPGPAELITGSSLDAHLVELSRKKREKNDSDSTIWENTKAQTFWF